jgi:hypothetical protein
MVEAVNYVLLRVQQERPGCGAWLESEFVVLRGDARCGYLELDV